ITGGGIIGNTKRILPKGRELKIDWNSWKLPKIFSLIQKTGNIPDEEMRSVFNLGIGLVAVVSPKDVEKIIKISKTIKEKAIVIGEVI
ncbi:MAG: AIR synthase-related protein, partial [Ignavibacteriaceae bacterium]